MKKTIVYFFATLFISTLFAVKSQAQGDMSCPAALGDDDSSHKSPRPVSLEIVTRIPVHMKSRDAEQPWGSFWTGLFTGFSSTAGTRDYGVRLDIDKTGTAILTNKQIPLLAIDTNGRPEFTKFIPDAGGFLNFYTLTPIPFTMFGGMEVTEIGRDPERHTKLVERMFYENLVGSQQRSNSLEVMAAQDHTERKLYIRLASGELHSLDEGSLVQPSVDPIESDKGEFKKTISEITAPILIEFDRNVEVSIRPDGTAYIQFPNDATPKDMRRIYQILPVPIEQIQSQFDYLHPKVPDAIANAKLLGVRLKKGVLSLAFQDPEKPSDARNFMGRPYVSVVEISNQYLNAITPVEFRPGYYLSPFGVRPSYIAPPKQTLDSEPILPPYYLRWLRSHL